MCFVQKYKIPIGLLALARLAHWETDWKMQFDIAKCHSIRMTRHPLDKQIQYDYSLHQQRLEQVQSAKYLGITITDDLDWGQHISENASKAIFANDCVLYIQYDNIIFVPIYLTNLFQMRGNGSDLNSSQLSLRSMSNKIFLIPKPKISLF